MNGVILELDCDYYQTELDDAQSLLSVNQRLINWSMFRVDMCKDYVDERLQEFLHGDVAQLGRRQQIQNLNSVGSSPTVATTL